jgi:hypothetical protein
LTGEDEHLERLVGGHGTVAPEHGHGEH